MHYVYGYCDGTPLDYYLWGHMKTLVYETKVDSTAALPHHIFAAAEPIRNHPHIIACATGSLKILAENCIATGGGHFELFNELLKNITPYLTRKDTVMRDSLSVEERLAVNLRFLATGRPFQDMKFSVTISPSAISQAVIETCEVLMFSRIT